tara:strand:+ start:1069 stop:2145 length:1077 start_codon:yes stop_codon:yes gene_type:complete
MSVNGNAKRIKSIADLAPDQQNANRGTQRGRGLLEKSLRQYGAGRSVLTDRDGNVIAGNKTVDVAAQLDLPVRVVETDGEELVVVQRTDLDLDSSEGRGLAIADNRTGEMGLEWDTEALLDLSASGTVDLEEFWKPEELEELFSYEPENIIADNIDKDIGDIKILNLYAGIGGNRKLWGDLKVTAVEYNPEIAKVYKDYFPNDEVVIDNAHDYLEKHFHEYDFIWSSPPCPTHSKMRKNMLGSKSPIYPDMKLWQEIIFLDGYFKGKWVVENVQTWYEPLIKPTKIGRHYYWSNFEITYDDKEVSKEIEMWGEDVFGEKKWGYDLRGYRFKSEYNAKKILRNMVHPKTGEAILKQAYT